MGWYLIAGTIPAAVAGLLWHDQIQSLFQNPLISAALIFVTGEILWLTKPHSLIPPGRDLRFGDSIVIGIAQAFAILPGISRSGSTISAGLLRDVDRESAGRFSFLLAIPVILGAGALEAVKLREIPQAEMGTLGIGVAVSAVTGCVALLILLRLIRAGRLHVFAWYCWAISLISLGWFWRTAVMTG
jgi:undecaprenyl-diphosphatase